MGAFRTSHSLCLAWYQLGIAIPGQFPNPAIRDWRGRDPGAHCTSGGARGQGARRPLAPMPKNTAPLVSTVENIYGAPQKILMPPGSKPWLRHCIAHVITDSNPGPTFSVPGFGIETLLMPGSRRDYVTTQDHK
jgi:hypothetical protein